LKHNKPIPATLVPLLQAAFNHHQASRLNEAERSYREVLRQVPKNFDVLHLLGTLIPNIKTIVIAACLLMN
jgi:hypothetical protein